MSMHSLTMSGPYDVELPPSGLVVCTIPNEWTRTHTLLTYASPTTLGAQSPDTVPCHIHSACPAPSSAAHSGTYGLALGVGVGALVTGVLAAVERAYATSTARERQRVEIMVYRTRRIAGAPFRENY